LKIITKKEAKATGLTKFFTGHPCNHGHLSERWTASKGCIECQKAFRVVYLLTPRAKMLKRKNDKNYKHKRPGITKKHRLKLKLDVLSHYSGGLFKCACCNDTHLEFLTIDHVDGGGRKHYKEIGGTGLYRWLRKNGYPKGFQVLCFNCNFAKHVYVTCPHQREEKIA